jgi:isochorismate hydrolase
MAVIQYKNYVGHFPMNQPSLDTLIHEIEATPGEYWEDLLTQLRQFRVNVTQQKLPVVDAHQLQKNQAAIALLNSWVNEGSTEEDTQAWETLKSNLDADCHPQFTHSLFF